MTGVWRWLRAHQGVIGFVVLAAFIFVGFQMIREQRADDNARGCISDWQIAEETRKVAPISNEALIEVFPDADPDRVRKVREVTARLVEERIADPDCDLVAARRELGR